MDDKSFDLLSFLENSGIHGTTDISDKITELFPIPNTKDESGFNIKKEEVVRFLRTINKDDWGREDGYVKYKTGLTNSIKTYQDNPKKWFDIFEVNLINDGIKSLKSERQIRSQNKLTESIETTNLTIGEVAVTQRNLAYISTIALAMSTAYLIA
jgi:hypothetical protein